MSSGVELLVYKFSSGVKWVIVPVGFRERILCLIKNDVQIEEILRIWRSGDIWASIKIKLLLYSHTSILQKGETITLVKANIPGLPMHQKVLWVQRAGTTVRNYGNVVEIKRFPLNLPKETSAKTITAAKDKKAIIPVRWEILPPGWWRTWSQVSHAQISKRRLHYEEVERLKHIDNLKPERWYSGKNYLGERIYYVAVFKNCVVAESATYGNAAYFVFDVNNWRTILSKTKREVLQVKDRTVLRVSHTHNWRSTITRIITGT